MDTIAAVATPHGSGGLAVIRISGSAAIERAAALFVPVRGKSPLEMEGYTCAYGYIMNEAERVDDVILTVFRAPHSYTGEDVAEISCHGGRLLAEVILRCVLCDSVRLAEPGEFTKRAFLNGKLSLTQAEAVADIISASGQNALRCARSLRDGASFRRISGISEKLLELLSDLAVWADYPDEDIPEVDEEAVRSRLEALHKEIAALAATYDYGRILREGIRTAIVGKPNVGKSTLFNALSGCERSIVTDIAGTTRDVVEEQVRIGGYALRLSDTAGMRETDEVIEQIGVERSMAALKEAELVLAVFDTSRPCSGEDASLLELLPAEKTICICNKSDLERVWEPDAAKFADYVNISAKTNDNLSALQQAVKGFASRLGAQAEDGMIANERQLACIQRAEKCVMEAQGALALGMDAVTVCLEDAEDALLQLTGERVSEQIVNAVFERFCVGK